MKKLVIGMLGIIVSLAGSSAMADGNWHPVLTCDGAGADGRPTVEVDNMDSYTGGRIEQPATRAQLVIRNPQIVQYFVQALDMQPTAFAPFTNLPTSYSGPGFSVQENQWIAGSGEQTFPAGVATMSFTLFDGPYGSGTTVKYDGSNLTVTVNLYGETSDDATISTANWTFHNCVAQ